MIPKPELPLPQTDVKAIAGGIGGTVMGMSMADVSEIMTIISATLSAMCSLYFLYLHFVKPKLGPKGKPKK